MSNSGAARVIELYTWQEEGFDICRGRLDRRKSPYAPVGPDYVRKLKALGSDLGTCQYLFCFCHQEAHRFYEGGKEWEWVLEAPEDKLLGYVASSAWDNYLRENGTMPEVRRSRPPEPEGWQALIPFPVPREWVACRREYRILSATEAQLMRTVPSC